jgi:hypothetical protein
VMSLVLAFPISFMLASYGVKLNMPPEHLLIIIAIVFAGGLAGCKD